MRLTSRWAAFLFLLTASAHTAFAIDPALSLDQHVVRTWGVDQGLPQGTVYALAQTGDGYMWAATQDVPLSGSAVWTGAEMIVWDGNKGARYDPVIDSWTTTSTSNAPAATLRPFRLMTKKPSRRPAAT